MVAKCDLGLYNSTGMLDHALCTLSTNWHSDVCNSVIVVFILSFETLSCLENNF